MKLKVMKKKKYFGIILSIRAHRFQQKIYFKVKQDSSALFVKGYEFLSFAKNISKNIGKNISKHFSGKCIQKRLDHPKQSITDALGTISKRVFLKTAELT